MQHYRGRSILGGKGGGGVKQGWVEFKQGVNWYADQTTLYFGHSVSISDRVVVPHKKK